MILHFFDKDFNQIDSVSLYDEHTDSVASSMLWTQSMFAPDDFAISIKVLTPERAQQLISMDAMFVVRDDNRLVGYIESRKYNFAESRVEYEGKDIVGFLKNRLTIVKEYSEQKGTGGTTGQIMCDLINDNLKPDWLVANRGANNVGPAAVMFADLTGTVASRIIELAGAHNVGFRTYYNSDDGKVHFQAIRITQDVMGVLGDELNNVHSLDFTRSESGHYNWIRVAGENEIISVVNNALPGETVLQIGLRANIRQEELTDDEYRERLAAWGRDELSRRIFQENFDTTPNENAEFFELGYLITCVSKTLNQTFVKSINSISETWEMGYRREYILGDYLETEQVLVNSVAEQVSNNPVIESVVERVDEIAATTRRVDTTLRDSDYVVEQSPRGSTTWFRRWNSGWVEQGGRGSSSAAEETIGLPRVMRDSEYVIMITPMHDGVSAGSSSAWYVSQTTSSFVMRSGRASAASTTLIPTNGTSWYVAGWGA